MTVFGLVLPDHGAYTIPNIQKGDLKSVVLHKMSMRSTQNSYPIALGVRITGVDDATFSQTGGLPPH